MSLVAGGTQGRPQARAEAGRAQVVLGGKPVVTTSTTLHAFQVLPSRHMAGLHFLAFWGSGRGASSGQWIVIGSDLCHFWAEALIAGGRTCRAPFPCSSLTNRVPESGCFVSLGR